MTKQVNYTLYCRRSPRHHWRRMNWSWCSEGLRPIVRHDMLDRQHQMRSQFPKMEVAAIIGHMGLPLHMDNKTFKTFEGV